MKNNAPFRLALLLLILVGCQIGAKPPDSGRRKFLANFRRNLKTWNTFEEKNCGQSYLNMNVGHFPCNTSRSGLLESPEDGDSNKVQLRAYKIQPGWFPSVVTLVCATAQGQNFICGGTLIGPELVLTATHCVRDKVACKIEAGFVHRSEQRQLPVEYFNRTTWAWGYCMLPNYSEGPNGWHNDVAMIQLNERLQFNEFIQPACIKPSHKPLDGALCFAVGFLTAGLGEQKRQILANQVRRGCSDVAAKKFDLIGRTCLEFPNGGNTCPGDSGMGLFCVDLCSADRARQFLVGVNSFGPTMNPGDCEKTTSFNFYSDLYKLQPEIDNMLKYCREFR